jgi:hypothetical protein
MEGPVVLVSSRPLPDDFLVERIFRVVHPQTKIVHYGVVRLRRTVSGQFNLDPPGDSKLLLNQLAIDDEVGEFFDLHEAVMFPTRDEGNE